MVKLGDSGKLPSPNPIVCSTNTETNLLENWPENCWTRLDTSKWCCMSATILLKCSCWTLHENNRKGNLLKQRDIYLKINKTGAILISLQGNISVHLISWPSHQELTPTLFHFNSRLESCQLRSNTNMGTWGTKRRQHCRSSGHFPTNPSKQRSCLAWPHPL